MIGAPHRRRLFTTSAHPAQSSRRAEGLTGTALKNGMYEAYRESSHIQLTSQAFPPSGEKDCSIRDDLAEMSSQT
jgi:hypothetical protein